jgi:hypothetical protein
MAAPPQVAPQVSRDSDAELGRELLGSALLVLLSIGSMTAVLGAVMGVLWLLS